VNIWKLKSLLSNEFEMKNLGVVGQILGMESKCDHAQKELSLG